MFNPYIVVPFLVWAITQFIKFSLAAFRGDIDFKYLYGSGGMPSVHSAVVTSLAVTALLVDGVNSPIFGLALIFAAIVMYDSFGVRRSAGEQARAINQILASMDRDRLDHPNLHLREILGHKPLEVTVGAVLGLVLAGLFNSAKLGLLFAAASLSVGVGMAIIVAALAIIGILAGVFVRWVLWREVRKVPEVATATRATAWTAWVLGLVGLLLAAAEYEKIAVATWVLWPIAYAVAAIAAGVAVPWHYWPKAQAAIAHYRQDQAKRQWFEGPNKQRRAKKAARAAGRRR